MPTFSELAAVNTLTAAVALYAASVPDWQIATDLNTPDVANGYAAVPLLTNEARRVLAVKGEWTAMDQALDAANTPTATITAIRVVMDILTLTDPLGEDDATALSTHLGTLVTAGLVSAASKAAIEAKGKRSRSWAEANGVEVTARTVGLARGAV